MSNKELRELAEWLISEEIVDYYFDGEEIENGTTGEDGYEVYTAESIRLSDTPKIFTDKQTQEQFDDTLLEAAKYHNREEEKLR